MVRAIQRKGLEVSGGFILGLDGDGEEVFDAQVAFIQEAGIPTAMVGLLTALRGTDLYSRFEREGRLLGESTGNNVEIALNFQPQLDRQVLIDGYRRVLATLYDPSLRSYFARCWTLLANLGPRRRQGRRRIQRVELLAFVRSLRRLLLSRQAPAYLGFLARTLRHRPRMFAEAVRMGIYGLHFQKFTLQTLAADEFRQAARSDYDRVDQAAADATMAGTGLQEAIRRQGDEALRRLRRLHRRLRPEFRQGLLPDWAGLEEAIRACVLEVPALQHLRRWAPVLRRWFTEPSWRSALASHGYALADRWRGVAGGAVGAGGRTLAVAPLFDQGKLRRSLELFLQELGVRVVTAAEQLEELSREGLAQLSEGGEASERLLGYLRALGTRVDTLIVPLAADPADPDDSEVGVQVLAAQAASTAARLPHLICVRCEDSKRRLRASLVELGVALTGDSSRAETAFDHAFALV